MMSEKRLELRTETLAGIYTTSFRRHLCPRAREGNSLDRAISLKGLLHHDRHHGLFLFGFHHFIKLGLLRTEWHAVWPRAWWRLKSRMDRDFSTCAARETAFFQDLNKPVPRSSKFLLVINGGMHIAKKNVYARQIMTCSERSECLSATGPCVSSVWPSIRRDWFHLVDELDDAHHG